ncbi:MAG: lipopolysaccharide transport periplasmic protein LptA [Rubrivivax sp.]
MLTALTPALRLTVAALLAGLALGAGAEKADRTRQIVIEADNPGTLDLQRQVSVFNGNVSITQGTMVIRADRVELREMPDGYRAATAIGSAARPASYRQKRDGVDETVEGSADRIEYDGRTDTLRFLGNGAVRRLRGGTVADEITGNLIVWDAAAEVFRVEGAPASAASPGGRVRAVLSPREAASAPAAPPAPLTPSRSIGDKP